MFKQLIILKKVKKFLLIMDGHIGILDLEINGKENIQIKKKSFLHLQLHLPDNRIPVVILVAYEQTKKKDFALFISYGVIEIEIKC